MAVSPLNAEREVKSSRVPNFILIHGVVHYFIHGFRSILVKGYPVSYRKHGMFELVSVENGEATINHRSNLYRDSRNARFTQRITIPVLCRSTISKGQHQFFKLTPKEYCEYERFLSRDTEHPEGLGDKYLMLFETFRSYWKENFAPSVQEEVDGFSFVLGARIRYGMACVMEGRAIPNDCQYEILLKQVDGEIGHRERSFEIDY